MERVLLSERLLGTAGGKVRKFEVALTETGSPWNVGGHESCEAFESWPGFTQSGSHLIHTALIYFEISLQADGEDGDHHITFSEFMLFLDTEEPLARVAYASESSLMTDDLPLRTPPPVLMQIPHVHHLCTCATFDDDAPPPESQSNTIVSKSRGHSSRSSTNASQQRSRPGLWRTPSQK